MKESTSSTGMVPVTIQLPAEIAERIQNFRKKLCGIKTNPYICNAKQSTRRKMSVTCGLFLCT